MGLKCSRKKNDLQATSANFNEFVSLSIIIKKESKDLYFISMVIFFCRKKRKTRPPKLDLFEWMGRERRKKSFSPFTSLLSQMRRRLFPSSSSAAFPSVVNLYLLIRRSRWGRGNEEGGRGQKTGSRHKKLWDLFNFPLSHHDQLQPGFLQYVTTTTWHYWEHRTALNISGLTCKKRRCCLLPGEKCIESRKKSFMLVGNGWNGKSLFVTNCSLNLAESRKILAARKNIWKKCECDLFSLLPTSHWETSILYRRIWYSVLVFWERSGGKNLSNVPFQAGLRIPLFRLSLCNSLHWSPIISILKSPLPLRL